MNSEIKVAFSSEKLSIKGCIQQPTPQHENEVIVGLRIFYNFSEALRKQVTMRLHTVCKYSINMIIKCIFCCPMSPVHHTETPAPAIFHSTRALNTHTKFSFLPKITYRPMVTYQMNKQIQLKKNTQDTEVQKYIVPHLFEN